MNSFRLGLTLFAASFAGAVLAPAIVILSPGSTWEYTFSTPADAGWKTGGGSDFVSGLAPFGNTSGGDFGYNTLWNADGADGIDVFARTTINLTGFDLSSITWDLGVDNGFALYVNGSLVSSDNAEGFTSRWEYSGNFGALLHSGVNTIAVELEDHGGLTAFDMQVSGNKSTLPPTVPDNGATIGLLLAGLSALALARRRA